MVFPSVTQWILIRKSNVTHYSITLELRNGQPISNLSFKPCDYARLQIFTLLTQSTLKNFGLYKTWKVSPDFPILPPTFCTIYVMRKVWILRNVVIDTLHKNP